MWQNIIKNHTNIPAPQATQKWISPVTEEEKKNKSSIYKIAPVIRIYLKLKNDYFVLPIELILHQRTDSERKQQMANPTGLSVAAVIYILTTIGCRLCASSSNNQTRLHMSGEVEGYPTNIFCRVPFDIRSTKVHINIVKYDFNKPDEIPELYFQFYWPWSSSGSELKCLGRRGVYLGYAVGQVLHIQIIKLSRKHEGRYECRHGLADHNDPGAIRNLYVKGTKIGCNTQFISSTDVTNITCHFNSDLTRTRDGIVLEWKSLARHTFKRVLTCMWSTSEVAWYKCYDGMHHHGITVHSLVKDKAIFNVPKKAHIHKGEFMCGTIPEHSNVDVETCTIENPEPTPPSTTTLSKKSSSHGTPGLTKVSLATTTSKLEPIQPADDMPVAAAAMPRRDWSVGLVVLLGLLLHTLFPVTMSTPCRGVTA